MPANTTNGLPYPLGTDRVADGDDAIKALAEALDPPWIVLALGGGFTAKAGSLVPAYRVIAGVVFLRGQVQKATAFVSTDIPVTLPAAARPSALVSVALAMSRSGAGASSPTARGDIATTGTLTTIVDSGFASNWVSFDGVAFSK